MLLTVTVNDIPTEVVSVITGVGPVGSTSVTSIGSYVGTTAQFTYSVTPFVNTSLVYVWTLPLGVNVVSGQGTNSLVVNFANVPFGAGNVGSIQIQAQNASGCRTAAKTLALTKVLPGAPTTVAMTDKASAAPSTAVTSYAKYMGSTTPLTLTAAAVVAASTYEWELPAGVTISIPAGTPAPVTTTVNYTAEPFFSPSTGTLPLGTRFWTVTNNAYTIDVNGVSTTITVSTCAQRYQGSSNNNPYPSTSAPYLQYGTVVRSNLPSILVNFAGVTNPTTTALYFGVRSLNGVGYSVTANATNADVVANRTGIPGLFNTTYTATETLIAPPSTQGSTTYTASGFAPKTSKLLKLVAALPAAPTALKLTNDAVSTSTAVTVVSKFIGTITPLTLTATASATASSYTWELPDGVNQVSGGNSNVITINFANVAPGVTSFYLGCKAVNGIGSSVTTTNGTLVPATTSTAKLLKVTATVPAAVTTVSGQITLIPNNAVINYTMTASALANSYIVTGPVGSVVTSAGNASNTTNSISTSDLVFTVTYPASFIANTANPKTIVITAVNGVGNSLTNKVLNLTSAVGNRPAANVLITSTSVYPNPVSDIVNIDLTADTDGTLEMTIYSYDGNVASRTKAVELKEGFNTINENLSNLAKGIYFLRITNSSNEEVIIKKIIKN